MDKASEVMKIVEWYLKGQGACFIFRNGERTFPIAVCTFPTAECTYRSGERIFRNGERTFRSAEYKISTLPF